ncbi:MAG: threonylcarbamoyl-AMP synthase [Deltaproteobacteria bacterium]|nr:threonylcarbamoyl-AMP synthase [Deltaproteobacteria bacterium]
MMPAGGLHDAVESLRQGGVVAYPTETLYALAVDIRRADAVERLRNVKSREAHKPLALLVADPAQILALVGEVSPLADLLMRTFWPGPLTLVFNAAPGLPPGITAETGTVAVRCSSHPVARALAQGLGGAITATGCNRLGGRAARTSGDVDPMLREQLGAVLEGEPAPSGVACSIVDARLGTPVIVREGAIKADVLQRVWA